MPTIRWWLPSPGACMPASRSSPWRHGSRRSFYVILHAQAVAEGIAGGSAGRAAPITAIDGTAGDRPDDTLRGIGRIAGERAQRVAIKESIHYLRGRTRESVVGELLDGVVNAGVRREDV